jgi:hypothetical protein
LQRALVTNMGVEGGTIDTIRRVIQKDLDAARPTHVVLNSVVNNHWFFDRSGHLARSFGSALQLLATQRERTYIVLEPELRFVRSPAEALVDHEAVRKIALEQGFSVVDPRQAFFQRREEFLFMDDCHLTKHGNRLLAEMLAREILSNAGDES